MTGTTACDPYGQTTVDADLVNYTVTYVVPTSCTLVTPFAIDFGNISSVGALATRQDEQGTITINCNRPYTVYLGDGGNRVAAGRGNRQMARGADRLPYQLYQDMVRSKVWDATAGTTALNGSGGVSGTGNARTRIFPSMHRSRRGSACPARQGNITTQS